MHYQLRNIVFKPACASSITFRSSHHLLKSVLNTFIKILHNKSIRETPRKVFGSFKWPFLYEAVQLCSDPNRQEIRQTQKLHQTVLLRMVN